MTSAPVRDVTVERAGDQGESGPSSSTTADRDRVSKLLVAALAAVLVLPLVVALLAYHKPTWMPVLDLAQTELRVRDVGTAHTPLIGLPGRIGTGLQQGSHPGPLSFYALAPTYRLFGSSAFALQIATVVVHAGAILAALFIARRRGRRAIVLGVAAMLAVLIAGFGVKVFTEPWNPYLPVLWWVVVLLAVWSVACGDHKMLPVAVAGGSFCAQTHVPYLVLCLGLGGVAAAAATVHFRKADAATRRSIVVWGLVAAGLGLCAWLPPMIDQIIHQPGNEAILIKHFTNPPPGEPPVGVHVSLSVVAARLDLIHGSLDQLIHPGQFVAVYPGRHVNQTRGELFLALWALAALAAVKLRIRSLILLHVAVAVGLVLLVFDVSRIFGTVWYYLLLPVWVVAALMGVALVWTAAALLGRVVPLKWRDVLDRCGTAALVVVIVLFCGRLAWAAPSIPHSDALISDELRGVIPGTLEALDHGLGGATGHAGRYLVSWDDAAYINSPGYGLLNELERRGFDVGAADAFSVIVTPHRVITEDQATARVELATGVWIDRFRALPGATQVAYFDPRTPVQQARFSQLHTELIALLHARGFDDLIRRVDDNLFSAAIDARVYYDSEIAPRFSEMLGIGVPMAVFISPPSVKLFP